jgi:hypothetical protein
MLRSPRDHLYRLIVVLLVGIAGFVWVKDKFVPEAGTPNAGTGAAPWRT